jgi:RNA polymerase sigma-70 factor (ECF subfamily)
MILKLTGKTKDKLQDEILLKKFSKEGDLEVLGVLYSRYMHLVYGVCMKYLKDREESKDAVLEIFEKIISEIPKHNIEKFSSWLHVVTKNYCLMKLRSAKTDDKNLKKWLSDHENFMEYDDSLHPLDTDHHDREKDLNDCIERLNSLQKDCIMKFYFENKCYREIAESLDADEKKVKSLLQNGKRNLKLCMEEKDGREAKQNI